MLAHRHSPWWDWGGPPPPPGVARINEPDGAGGRDVRDRPAMLFELAAVQLVVVSPWPREAARIIRASGHHVMEHERNDLHLAPGCVAPRTFTHRVFDSG